MSLIHNATWTGEDVSYNLCRSALLTPNGPFILLPGETYHIDVIADRNGSTDSIRPLSNKISRISLKRIQTTSSSNGKIQEFEFQNLNPYFDGKNCSSNSNCYACTSDSACAWCHGNCFDRKRIYNNQTGSNCSGLDLKLRPEQCSNCDSYISCSNCVEIANSKNGGLCEWNIQKARCIREGRFPPEVTVKNPEQCPDDCFSRKNCSQCVDDPGRCVWCESSQVSHLNIFLLHFSSSFHRIFPNNSLI